MWDAVARDISRATGAAFHARSRTRVTGGCIHRAHCVLHGDLWGGNASADAHGRPVVFDPATYYGDREADIAMTELFGGFPAGFHSAYRDAWPLDPGYARRKPLYQLYHVLNHLNLFGGSYLRQAEAMTARLLGEL